MSISVRRPADCLGLPLMAETAPCLWLWVVLGGRAFSEFQKKFGGRKMWIPKYKNIFPCACCPYRCLHIQMLHAQGKSVRWLAKRFGLSAKHLYALLKCPSAPRLSALPR